MEWTVSAAKGVRKLSLRHSVICTWTWSRAVTSLYIRESSNGVECQPPWLFCRRKGSTAHFHRERFSTGAKLTTQPAEPLWRRDWRWQIKQNLLRQWEATRLQSGIVAFRHVDSVGLRKNTWAQSWFVFSLSRCITITTQRKWKEEEEIRKALETLEVLFRGYIYTECSIVGAQ